MPSAVAKTLDSLGVQIVLLGIIPLPKEFNRFSSKGIEISEQLFIVSDSSLALGS